MAPRLRASALKPKQKTPRAQAWRGFFMALSIQA